jgi:hypothetical protein
LSSKASIDIEMAGYQVPAELRRAARALYDELLHNSTSNVVPIAPIKLVSRAKAPDHSATDRRYSNYAVYWPARTGRGLQTPQRENWTQEALQRQWRKARYDHRTGELELARTVPSASGWIYYVPGLHRGPGAAPAAAAAPSAQNERPAVCPRCEANWSKLASAAPIRTQRTGFQKTDREGQILFTFLHLAPDPVQAKGLIGSGCTAVAYETVTDPKGGLPLLAPMSEVAGRLSIEAAGTALKRHAGGRGLLIGGVPGVKPARIVVIGGGVVGTNAARMAAGLGAEVTILDRSIPRLRELDELFETRARTRFSTIEAIEDEAFSADVVIGAVLVPGRSAPRLLTRQMLKSMRRGAVLVDVAIDQGGCFETSRATTHADPTYELDGVIHYRVANMPRFCSRDLKPSTQQCDLAVRPGIGKQGFRSGR